MRALVTAAALLLLVAPAATHAVGQATPPVAAPEVNSQMLVAKLRGIRATPPAVKTTATPAAVTAGPAPSVDLAVPFQSGSAALDAGAVQVLGALGTALTDASLKDDRFLIEGHTDTMGNKPGNLALSGKRARAVAAYLISHFDIAPQRLTAKGVGEADLAVDTPDQTDEPKNRRVKVVNLGPK